jgi:nucleotide-binding universal stress UspA family protein
VQTQRLRNVTRFVSHGEALDPLVQDQATPACGEPRHAFIRAKSMGLRGESEGQGFTKENRMQLANAEKEGVVAERTVVVPIDFSSASITATKLGMKVARETRAQLIFCHALFSKVVPFGRGCPPWIESALREEAMEKIKPFMTLAQEAGLRATCVVEDGTPAGVIIRVARRHRAELIVLTSREPGVWGRLFFGPTVAEQVSRSTDCHVMIARSSTGEKMASAGKV